MDTAPTPAPSVIAGLKQALKPHAPFSAMDDAALDRIVRASRLRYFEPGETILAPAATRPDGCYVIRQGAVRGERPHATMGNAILWELGVGEMFPLNALIAHRGVTSVYRAAADTFCLVFPAAVFDLLIAGSLVFQDFCARRLAYLLDLSRIELQAQYAANVIEQHPFDTQLGHLLQRALQSCPPDASVANVLATMEAQRIGSMVVVDGDQNPLGIFTRQDVIGRVVLVQRPLTTAIREVMSSPAISLPEQATAVDGALLMAQRGIRHIVVVDRDRRCRGVVSERDLFGLQRLSVRELASAINRAGGVPPLVQCANDIRALSHGLVAQGLAAGPITRMISTLNDKLTARVLDLTASRFDLSGLLLCWLGMGSEGRHEQTIASDQDNGLIFVVQEEVIPPDAARERLLPFARAVNETLDRCGYPLCRGGVMAMNPRWCASLEEWRIAFEQWIDAGDPGSLLAANIFFDFRALWGTSWLAQTLRADIAEPARANSRFLKQMSDNALANRPPLSWRGEVQGAQDKNGVVGIDLKMSASAPIVDAARILALASGVTATNTVERLEGSVVERGLPAGQARALCDAFEFVQLLRLREQHRRAATTAGERPDSNPNLVPLAALSELDRRILAEALREVRRIQQRLELDYPG